MSRPSFILSIAATTWVGIGMVADSNLGGANTLSVTAYALCSL